MRPGLASVGAVLLILALAALAVVSLSPPGTRQVQLNSLIPNQTLAPNANYFALLTGTNASSGTFSVTWTASVSAYVRLFSAPGCHTASAACAQGTPVRTWVLVLGGTWSTSGPLGFPYLIEWSTNGTSGGTWSATAIESVTTSIAPDLWSSLVIYAAGAALAIVGGIALFLGLFLRGGVYRAPAPLVSRSADDAQEIARSPAPRTK